MALPKFAFHHALAVANARETHVADIGLGSDVGHRHTVAQLASAQVGVKNHREFVSGPEAAGAWCGADDDGPWIFQKALIVFPSL